MTTSTVSVNYDEIRTNLKQYLSGLPALQDYNFDSSTMSILLNLLAFNSYHNAIYNSLSNNERFLDSAQLRRNVVAKAKERGYTPITARGAMATIRLSIVASDQPASITVPSGTAFKTTLNNVDYTFVVPADVAISPTIDGQYTADIEIVEGIQVTHSFVVSSSNPVRYILPNPRIDSSSIRVSVRESATSSNVTQFTAASDILFVDRDTNAFFVQEADDEYLEIYFGDGVLGTAPQDGSIVSVSYRVCSGVDANGANAFSSASGTIAGYSQFTIATIVAAANGTNAETIESIKFNAPKYHSAQNRAVVPEDFVQLMRRGFGDIQAVQAWGGEDNNPPIYGTVFICAKPVVGTLFSQAKKDEMRSYIRRWAMMTHDVRIVDPTYLYVVPSVVVRFDPSKTTQTGGEVSQDIERKLQSIESAMMNKFAARYINSTTITEISKVSSAIVAVDVELAMQKRFVPNTTVSTTYQLAFNNSIYNPHVGHVGSVYSSAFTYEGKKCYIEDDGNGNIVVYYVSTANAKVVVNSTAGTVDYSNGLVVLQNLAITDFEGVELKVYAVPEQSVISAARNQLLLIADAGIKVVNDQTDSIISEVKQITTNGVSMSMYDSGVTLVTY